MNKQNNNSSNNATLVTQSSKEQYTEKTSDKYLSNLTINSKIEMRRIGSLSTMKNVKTSTEMIKCSGKDCGINALFQCDKCKSFFSCSNPCKHEKEWNEHFHNCPALKNETEKKKIIEFVKHGTKYPSLPENNKLIISPDSPDKNNNFTKATNAYKLSRAFSNRNPNLSATNGESDTTPGSTTRNCKREKESSTLSNYINNQMSIETKLKLIPFKPSYYSLRAQIVNLINNKKYSEAIEKVKILISQNVSNLTNLIESNTIIPFGLMEQNRIAKFDINDTISSYLYYEEYISNLLLAIEVYSEIGSKEQLNRMLNHLISEIEHYNIHKVIEILIPHIQSSSLLTSSSSLKYKQLPKSEITIKLESIYYKHLKILIVISQYSYYLKEYLQYEKYILNFIQKIQCVFYTNLPMISKLYLLLANLYRKLNFIQKSHLLYEAIIAKNNINKNEEMYECLLNAYYNSGVIFHEIGKSELAKQRLESAITIKETMMREKSDKNLSEIYETLCEVSVEIKEYSNAYSYLQKAIKARESALFNADINEDKNKESFWKKIEILQQFLEKKVCELNPNTQNEEGKKNIKKVNKKTDDAEDDKMINDFLTENYKPKISREVKDEELKQFFLFIGSLSKSQIKKLNFDQPNDTEANKKLPIIFTEEFKESLNHKQRIHFCSLQLTNLSRLTVLRNYNKKIKIKNLNFEALYHEKNDKMIEEMKHNYKTRTILQNWEIDPNNNDNINNNFFLKRETLDILNEKLKREQKRKNSVQNMNVFDVKNTKEQQKKAKVIINEIISKDSIVNYDKLKQYFISYCEKKMPSKLKIIDDQFILLISREMDLDNLKKIILNEDIIPEIIESYELKYNNN